jgi:hypothetical protein
MESSAKWVFKCIQFFFITVNGKSEGCKKQGEKQSEGMYPLV